MFKDRLDYIRQLFAPETAAQKSIRETTPDNISIHPEEGKFLQLLVRLSQARKIVEIGTFAGYSTHWLADALPPDGKIWTIEKDAARADAARANLFPLSVIPAKAGISSGTGAAGSGLRGNDGEKKIILLEGDALQELASIEAQGPFDMVFIDADKVNYLHYLGWAERHVRKGGLIVGDNTFLFDAVWKDGPVERVRDTARQAMREFNRRLADPEKYASVMLPTEEGMTIAMKMF